jgi:hypothetical protein
VGVTAVTSVENLSSAGATLVNAETGRSVAVASGDRVPIEAMSVPWCASSADDFGTKHLRLDAAGGRYWIWQANNADGDHVRFSIDARWHDCGEPVDGVSIVNGPRTLVVLESGFRLISIPEELIETLRSHLDTSELFRLDHSIERAIPSVPKRSAVAFSIAGPPYEGRNCIYRDSGKRYAFRLDGGVVVAASEGSETRLTRAVSYARRRAGQPQVAPPMDLIAANGGRVFAKAKEQDRFYFAMLDEMFMHCVGDGVFAVPSTYFKLDPEFNQPAADRRHLTAHIDGWFRNHPSAERFPLFRPILEAELADVMIVRVERGVWHEIDARPPLGALNLQVAILETAMALRVFGTSEPNVLTRVWSGLRARLEETAARAREGTLAPPPDVPSYEHVVYRASSGQIASLRSIAFARVLDIGVGHVHWHEQYEGITGGEIQPMLDARFLPQVYQWGYRYFNGSVRDGDGYIDGTCNFYALVELGEPGEIGGAQRYALLYQDEQSYFTQRWRMVDPRDSSGLVFALVTDLETFDFDEATYWCPFRAGEVGSKSRLAVAAQVLLVTGDAARAYTRVRIYSINFSWGTMDRTWRWRLLPTATEVRYFDAAAEASGAEPIDDGGREAVYPQTIRLRGDMTLHVKGTRDNPAGRPEVGRWYQRYLPAANALLPAADALAANARPAIGYSHPWKFLPERVFELADQFSHFGVYDNVDSRCHYYLVEPASSSDELAFAGVPGPWVDSGYALSRWSPKFQFAAPGMLIDLFNLGALERRPPSLFNRQTQLRVVRRGGRLIAMHWDKRDDDLLPFGSPVEFWPNPFPPEPLLTCGTRRARVKLHFQRYVDEPPAIERCEFRWSGEAGEAASIALFPPADRPGVDTLWRIRISALVLERPGTANHLLVGEVSGHLSHRAAVSSIDGFRAATWMRSGATTRTRALASSEPLSGSRTSSGMSPSRSRRAGCGRRRSISSLTGRCSCPNRPRTSTLGST